MESHSDDYSEQIGRKRSSPAELYHAFRAREAPVADSFRAGRALWFSIHQPVTCVTRRAVNPVTFMATVRAPAPAPPLVSFLINLCCNELPPGDVLSSAPSEVGTRLESRLRGRKRAEMMQQKVGRDVPAAQDRLQFRTLSLLVFAQTCYLNIHSFLAVPFICPIWYSLFSIMWSPKGTQQWKWLQFSSRRCEPGGK